MPNIIFRHLGLQDYQPIWQAMRDFTRSRTPDTPDEIWMLQHPPIFTQGQAGKPEHILNISHIPICQSDRGGQVTYHGPGQLIAYILLDLKHVHLGIRSLITALEDSIIALLKNYDLNATTQQKAPGVYIQDQKICSIGLRVRNSCTYHGIALNVDMDLSPFNQINPCGYHDLKMTQMRDQIQDHKINIDINIIEKQLSQILKNKFK